MKYENTALWKNAFRDAVDLEAADRIRSTLATFRSRASDVTSKIASEFPELTIHDVSHLDALWETADLVAGDPYPLNPLEAFVFGGAVFLHDAALCFEAYDGGRDAVRSTIVWQDCRALEQRRRPEAAPNDLDLAADFIAVRQLHATQAEGLGTKSWKHPSTGDALHFIEDADLRIRYGNLIGKIAGSHHWPIEDLSAKLPNQVNAPGNYPLHWRVDPIKIACLLRVADAMHIDGRRAPDFLFALLKRQGISFDHWKAQNWLARIDVDQSSPDQESLLVSSNKDFAIEDSDAWWVAYDAANLAEKEIRSANTLLASRTNSTYSPPFKFKKVTGANDPAIFAQSVRTSGWHPHAVQLHVGNVRQLVSTLGGTKLYGMGTEFTIALRELIQNARDAIVAREEQQPGFSGRILIKLDRTNEDYTKITVDDDGVGMSSRVLTGPLLDFGSTFWVSDLVKSEFPGLAASNFRSSGRFGIGFYAAFMAAERLTIASRRWDRGHDTVAQLIFPSGLSLRPIIKSGAPEFFTGFTSTAVCMQVSAAAFPVDRTPIMSDVDGSIKTTITFDALVSALSCGLDVDVIVSTDGGPEGIAHRSLKKEYDHQQKLEWLRSISHSKFRNNSQIERLISEAAGRLTDIVRDGRLILRGALNTAFRDGHFSSAITVDGLGNSHYGSNYYIGFADHTTTTAKRDAAALVATHAELEVWLNEQIALTPQPMKDLTFMANIPYIFSNIGISPGDYCRIFLRKNDVIDFVDINKTIEILENEPIAYFLSNHMPIIETYIQEKKYEDYWTIMPIKNGSFIWTDLSDPEKNSLSFLGLLNEQVVSRGNKLIFSKKKTSTWSIGGEISAVVVSMVEADDARAPSDA